MRFAATFSPGSEVFAEIYDDYDYASTKLIKETGLPRLSIAPNAIHGGHFSTTVSVSPGQLVDTGGAGRKR